MEVDICPRWLLATLRIPERSRDQVAFFLSTFVVIVFLPLIRYIPHFCLMQKLLGIPCPGCGVSRSLMAIARLRPAIAWAANPAGFGIAGLFLFQFVARPIALIFPQTDHFVSDASRRLGNAVLMCLLCVWIQRLR